MLRVDRQQQHRLAEIIDNLKDRIEEASRHGWLGEVQGLQISLDAARAKMVDAQRTRHPDTAGPVLLGLPTNRGKSDLAESASEGEISGNSSGHIHHG